MYVFVMYTHPYRLTIICKGVTLFSSLKKCILAFYAERKNFVLIRGEKTPVTSANFNFKQIKAQT